MASPGDDDDATRSWRLRVAEAARRAADQLRAENHPYHRRMIADLDELHTRLTDELELEE